MLIYDALLHCGNMHTSNAMHVVLVVHFQISQMNCDPHCDCSTGPQPGESARSSESGGSGGSGGGGGSGNHFPFVSSHDDIGVLHCRGYLKALTKRGIHAGSEGSSEGSEEMVTQWCVARMS